MTWYTVVGGTTGATDYTRELVAGPGTIRRLIVQLGGGHAASGVGAFGSFHWVVNVGPAAADPNLFGQDPPDVMLHGAALIPDTADYPVGLPPPAIDLDSDGDRLMGPDDSLWLRIRGGAPVDGWSWVFSIRVLVT